MQEAAVDIFLTKPIPKNFRAVHIVLPTEDEHLPRIVNKVGTRNINRRAIVQRIRERPPIDAEHVERSPKEIAAVEDAPAVPNKRKQKVPALIEDEPIPPRGREEPAVPRKAARKKKELVVIPSVEMDQYLKAKLPPKRPLVNIRVPEYIMNNRETFTKFIRSIFATEYKTKLADSEGDITCDNIGSSSSDFELLVNQQIVRDYINAYTPYRGLLLMHGLGSGKTCTSIAIAEGLKETKRVVVMTPASLQANYVGELKKCGDQLFKKTQHWEWISLTKQAELATTAARLMDIPSEILRKHKGVFLIDSHLPSNYDSLSDSDRVKLEAQLEGMIRKKYEFINYNGLRADKLKALTKDFTENIFDNSIVIIDEAHNLVSRIVNKLKKEPDSNETSRGEKTRLATNLSVKLYEMLLGAKNARIVLLSGTPVINYPNEFAVVFNILRGYIKTWNITLSPRGGAKVDEKYIRSILSQELNSIDYIQYSPTSRVLQITRNPYGFQSVITSNKYKGVASGGRQMTDDEFEKEVISILKTHHLHATGDITIRNFKALPDSLEEFNTRFINTTSGKVINANMLKRRIVGLSSYFKSAQEGLLPVFNKRIGDDYHIVNVSMSDYQFTAYETARIKERKSEKPKNTKNKPGEETPSSSYRIFSRLFCNYVIENRPLPELAKSKGDGKKDIDEILKEGARVEIRNNGLEREGEIEADEIFEKMDTTYAKRLAQKIQELSESPEKYFSKEALSIYSPKYLAMLEHIQDPDNIGLHLVYSQFRTAEGIGLFAKTLEYNGYVPFIIKKTAQGWTISPESLSGSPTFALYTGTEGDEEKDLVRKIYNGDWDDIPPSLNSQLRERFTNNNLGEVIKVFMITSSGSEGINLKNTRFVHLMDPYWHPVRAEQVIGRARRICSHKNLPKELQTVEVFVYLMQFTEEQLSSEASMELKKRDLSKSLPRVPQTSDQYLYELSEIKAKIVSQLVDIIKESAFDCFLHSPDGRCLNFGNSSIDKFSYTPDYHNQQDDQTTNLNKETIRWAGKEIKIEGVKYIARIMSPSEIYIYDHSSYPENPLQLGSGTLVDGKWAIEWVVR